MYDINEIRKLYERLKTQYPQYESDFSGERLTLTTLYGRVEVNREGCRLFVNENLYDELPSAEIDKMDDLYELIELFLLQMRQAGIQGGNETYMTANNMAVRWGTRALLSACALSVGCSAALLLTKNLLWLVLLFLCPLAGYQLLRMMRLKAFVEYWVCPECGHDLPLDEKSRFPQMEYVGKCPHCGSVLEKAPDMEPIRLEADAPKKQLDSNYIPPVQGKKWPCILAGSISIAFSLFMFAVALFAGEPVALPNAAAILLMLLPMFLLGLALLLCRHIEPNQSQPIVVMREQKAVTIIGMILWLFGAVLLFMGIAVAVAVPVDGITAFFGLTGSFVFFFGTWMLLAGCNRTLFVFQDQSIWYISSWGRLREFEVGQVASVRLTLNRSIHLLDKNGKKLFSVEINMRGAERFAEWVESMDFAAELTPSMEKQVKLEEKAEELIQWREEYRTPWHDHISAIRKGRRLVTLLLAVGVIIPLPLYLFADVKFRTVMAIAAAAPVPFLIFCIVFAPVLIFGDRPKNATAEWNDMYIQISVPAIFLPVLALLWQVHYVWDRWIMQVRDNDWIWLFQAALIAVPVFLLCLYRIPKQKRFESAFFIGFVCIGFGMCIPYCANAALCRPAHHYPAVVVDSHKADPDTKRDDDTLTVRLDDGSKEKLCVFDTIYEMAMAGEPLSVCHSESPFGMEFLKIHIPKSE